MSSRKEAELAALIRSPATFNPDDNRITMSGGLAAWLLDHRVSLAFTSYQTGQMVLAGVGPDGRLSFNEQNYARAMGLCRHGDSLFVGAMFQIWRLENMLKPGEFANNAFDMALVPRTAHTLGYVDAHEFAVDAADRLIFVNSRFSCLAVLDERHSFRPIWKPPFISKLAPEDRCHLNGMAMLNGAPHLVTAIGTSDVKDGWREHREHGGALIHVESGEIITGSLSMPHSPRIEDGIVWALDSGRGNVVQIDPASGAVTPVAFCPGFLRGLAFHDGFALVTVSKAREGGFRELPLQAELERRGLEAWCGVLIIDLASGEIVHWIRYAGKVTEMFDVAVLPNVRNPMSVGPATVEMIGAVTIADEWAPLRP